MNEERGRKQRMADKRGEQEGMNDERGRQKRKKLLKKEAEENE